MRMWVADSRVRRTEKPYLLYYWYLADKKERLRGKL